MFYCYSLSASLDFLLSMHKYLRMFVLPMVNNNNLIIPSSIFSFPTLSSPPFPLYYVTDYYFPFPIHYSLLKKKSDVHCGLTLVIRAYILPKRDPHFTFDRLLLKFVFHFLLTKLSSLKIYAHFLYSVRLLLYMEQLLKIGKQLSRNPRL